MNKKSLLADFALLMVAVVWGSNFVVMKDALELITPFMYLSLRFGVSFFILVVLFYKRIGRLKFEEIKAGSIIGFFLFSGFALQTVGLLSTTPGKSGFITGMNVVIVPFLYFFVTGKFPGVWPIIGGVLAVIGLGFLSITADFTVNMGDVLTLISAFMFAGQIVSIGIYARKHDPVVLTALQLGITALASWIVAVIAEPINFNISFDVWGAIIYAVIFCTIGAFLTQNIAQKFTPSTHAAIILCLESVFAVVFSYFFWGEHLTPKMVTGCILILMGVLITELQPKLPGLVRKSSRTRFSEE